MRSTRSSSTPRPTARGSEQELLLPVIEAIEPAAKTGHRVCADSGYHSEANLKALEQRGHRGLIPDNTGRKRDPRYAGQEQHTATSPMRCGTRARSRTNPNCSSPSDFQSRPRPVALHLPGRQAATDASGTRPHRATGGSRAPRDCKHSAAQHPGRSRAVARRDHPWPKRFAGLAQGPDRAQRRIDHGRELRGRLSKRLTRGIEAILGEEAGHRGSCCSQGEGWTSATAFGKDVSIEFTITPKRKQIIWLTIGAVIVTSIVLAAIAFILIR